MSFTPQQVGDMNAARAELIGIADSVRNPIEQQALMLIATLLGFMVEEPGTGPIAVLHLARLANEERKRRSE